jgi:hypothetical protein
MQNCWNLKGKNKETQWKPMVVERGKTFSRFKEKSNFNREVVYPYLQIRRGRSSKDHW